MYYLVLPVYYLWVLPIGYQCISNIWLVDFQINSCLLLGSFSASLKKFYQSSKLGRSNVLPMYIHCITCITNKLPVPPGARVRVQVRQQAEARGARPAGTQPRYQGGAVRAWRAGGKLYFRWTRRVTCVGKRSGL